MKLWKLLCRWLRRREKKQAPLPSSQLALARLKALYEHDEQPFQMPTLNAFDFGLMPEPKGKLDDILVAEVEPPVSSIAEQLVSSVFIAQGLKQNNDVSNTVVIVQPDQASCLPAADKKRGVLLNASDAAIRQVAAIIAARHGLSLTVDLPSGEVARIGCQEGEHDNRLIWHDGDYRVRSQGMLYDMPSGVETLYHALHVLHSGHTDDYLLGPATLGVVQLYVPPRRQAAEKVITALAKLRYEVMRSKCNLIR
ncbi:hypothetical protein [Pseudomonas koreensis]|uniref:hypothetical protein n=1 Tax=Pseudomonas koreensis TaxID=198620 RepID=UPI003F832389